MNTMDFSALKPLCTRVCGVMLLSVLASVAMAAPTASTKAIPRNPLVLTLSDQWLATNTSLSVPANGSDSQSTNPSQKQRAVNVNCGMDANPLVTYDNSLGNRLQGECNLGYRY